MSMTREEVRRWLAAMKAEGFAKSDADCARALGVHPNTITNWRNHGILDARRTRLAMAALLAGLGPYSPKGTTS